MRRDFHFRIIKKLSIGWLFLSLIIGVPVAYTEFEQIDSSVVLLAESNSAQLIAIAHRYFHNETAEIRSYLETTTKDMATNHHFVMIEVYDRKKNKIIDYAQPQIEGIIDTLEGREHESLMGSRIEYMKILHDHVMYLKLIMPIIDPEDQSICGYFEGIYQVTDQELKQGFLEKFPLKFKRNSNYLFIKTVYYDTFTRN
jgi:hypothetical protein